jgi:hypothetical protein
MTEQLEPAPAQYMVGERCFGCDAYLSRYNAHVYCGACRVRLLAEFAEAPDDAPAATVFPWERWPTRPVLTRGPLSAMQLREEWGVVDGV